MNTVVFPDWFRDSISRVDDGGIVIRMNEDARKEIERIARDLGWSYARVVRVLVNKGLDDLRRVS